MNIFKSLVCFALLYSIAPIRGNNPNDWISAFNHNGSFTIERILSLPLSSMADREYIGGALMGGTLVR